MSVLMIGPMERASIAKLIALAKAKPIPLPVVMAGVSPDTTVLTLADRPQGFERPPSHQTTLPGGFRVALSYEDQPAGMCAHLSISVEGRPEKGAVPLPQAVALIAKEFGVPFPPDRTWIEEFEPGEFAVHLVSVIARRQVGHG